MPRKPTDKLPESAGSLEPITKAAVLLLSLGPDQASEVL